MNSQINAARALGAKALKIARPSLLGRQLRVVPFGDSITQTSSIFQNGMWQYGSGYAETSLGLAGRRFTLASNAGISGNTTTQMLARIQTDVLAYSPDVVLLLGGTNDLSSGMANSAFTTMFRNLETMVKLILNAGAVPVIVTCPPKNTSAPESRKAQVFYYMLAQAYGLPLIDLYRFLVDPATGNYITSYSDDGTHPNPVGIAAIAAFAGPILSNIDSAWPGPYLAAFGEATAGNFPNLLRNGNFQTQTTPPTPDSWVVNSTNATVTGPAATAPYTGKTFTYQKTSGTGVYALSGSNPATGWAAGDTLVFSGRLKSSGRSSPAGFHMAIDRQPTGTFRPLFSWLQDGDFVFSAEMVVPASTTQLTPTLFTNDVGTLEVNNLTLWNKTAALAVWAPSP